jgi:lysylphosphatidylglycerol synthase-like protein
MKRLHSPLWVAGSAAIGIGLLVWTIVSVGPGELASQVTAVRSVLPMVLALAAVRFGCQAAGWRLAMTSGDRPAWQQAFSAVVAGEAAGYFAWGPVSREPMKALLVSDRLPIRDGLAAAMVERLAYTLAATGLSLIALGMLAVSRGHGIVFTIGLAIFLAAAGAFAPKVLRRFDGQGRSALYGLAALSAGQEALNVVEASAVLAILGASPMLASVVILEGMSRILNSAGQFVPGKLGVSEAASAALAGSLQIGSAHGLTLALVRRVRSLLWGAIGVVILTLHAGFARTRARRAFAGSEDPAYI